jgi:hypothetical protein
MTIMRELLLATATCLAFAGMANACGPTIPRVCYLRTYERAHLAKHPNQFVSAMRVSLSPAAENYQYFELGVQFREDKIRVDNDKNKDKWEIWTADGLCSPYGPGLTCTQILDGCDIGEEKLHFYIHRKTSETIYLHPRRIELYNGAATGKNNEISRIFLPQKDDDIFRLDKTVCWKEE